MAAPQVLPSTPATSAPDAAALFKCAKHKHRTQCLVLGCCRSFPTTPQLRHKHNHSAQHRTKRLCIVEGCIKQAHARQKCVRHGGGKLCKVDDCSQHARANGVCYRHRSLSNDASDSRSRSSSQDTLDDAHTDDVLVTSQHLALSDFDLADDLGDETALDRILSELTPLEDCVFPSLVKLDQFDQHPCLPTSQSRFAPSSPAWPYNPYGHPDSSDFSTMMPTPSYHGGLLPGGGAPASEDSILRIVNTVAMLNTMHMVSQLMRQQ